jgi:hypothetical protein
VLKRKISYKHGGFSLMGVFHLLSLGISTGCGSILEILKIVSLFIKLPRSVEAVMAVIVW